MNKILSSLKKTFLKEKESPILYPHALEIIGGKLVCLDMIPEESTIISGGVGNDVGFELELIKRKGVKVVGIDPTNTAADYIEKRRQKQPVLQENYIYVKKALSGTNEPIRLYFGENDGMSSVSSQHRDAAAKNYFICESVTIPDLLREYSGVSYLKLDIEGAEYAMIEKLENLSVPQVSIEFHHHCSTEYTLAQTIAMIQKIEKMGYDVIDYGAYFGRDRRLPMYASKWSDLNCELLFIKR